MSQVTSGLRSALNYPWVYSAFQKLVGSERMMRRLVDTCVRPQVGQRLLDVGCGPGDLMAFLPPGVSYVGVDLSADYIDSARRRFGDRGTFVCANVASLPLLGFSQFDAIVAIGLLHHLDDAAAIGLCQTAARLLAPEGRLVLVEPCRHGGQSRLERNLMDRDRGQHVRNANAYREIAAQGFGKIDLILDSKLLRIPWTLAVLTAVQPIAIGNGSLAPITAGLSPQ